MKKVIFPIFFQDESCKAGFAFYLRALETIFGTLKNGKNNPEIANLEFESQFPQNHFFIPTEKLGQIYGKWYIKT